MHSVLLEPQLYYESNEASEDSLQELVRKNSDVESRSPYGNNLHDNPQMNIKTIDRAAAQDAKAQMQLMQVQHQSCLPNQRLKAVREMLASFFKRRPAIDTLKSRGIIQGKIVKTKTKTKAAIKIQHANLSIVYYQLSSF